jgi:hypothetical protein
VRIPVVGLPMSVFPTPNESPVNYSQRVDGGFFLAVWK